MFFFTAYNDEKDKKIEENLIKDVRNIFRLTKEINDNVIKV